jgi:CSLREA domain-containing protein
MKGRSLWRRPRLVALLALVLVCVGAPPAASAVTFVVNSSDDLPGPCTGLHCTLRAAITEANSAPGRDRIEFDIPPGGPQTIHPVTQLPPITDPVIVDGTTQPGYSGEPVISIDGTTGGLNGLTVTAGDSTIQALHIYGYFGGAAIELDGGADNLVVGNYLGAITAPGTSPLANGDGVRIQDSNTNLIGGVLAGSRNVISGNNFSGVLILGNSDGNSIVGNFIGTDPTGTTAFPYGNDVGVGTDITVSETVVGDPNPNGANVIAGNFDAGVILNGFQSRVVGNKIGTDVTGQHALPNLDGVDVQGANNHVGTANQGQGNVISGNNRWGIRIGFRTGGPGDQPIADEVSGNLIGVEADGTTPLPNVRDGIQLDNGTEGATIGGPAPFQPNVIAFNGGAGVNVVMGTRNSILDNSIYANGGLGIEFASSPATIPNDPGDADTGPNELQNHPMLSQAFVGNGSTKVEGSLDSMPLSIYRIQFFGSDACDPSGFGEGQTFLSERDVTTDATGAATFSFTLGSQAGDFVTATATDQFGNTSEFSNCTHAQPIVFNSTTVLSPANAVNPVGTTHTVTATVTGGVPEQPLTGVAVFFTVSGSVSTTGQCTTDLSGQCSFTYQGPSQPGADVITAYADANGNNTQDAVELSGTATKEWSLNASTPGQVTGGGQIQWVTGKVVFGFNAQNEQNGVKGNCNLVDVASDLHLKCLTVTSLVVAGTHATFSGQARIAGLTTNYRIDVDDLAEPGTGRDTFKIQTDAGYTASGVLTAGNIQIHG